eukprot:CAMPEP_0206201998 /NCGR_PEP_ID=MMETSP0166-20121206/11896_1 /ASSEMBLY_ACC=CAM_ASM_000260 /TAXON_ID=95228 /ORGANISM="Vannella robusta, Strain DIVA3 518/3/11/1/6" /LENGTH=129 /DNA_ID=CAMNT_0053620809 /DNA_START=30 /DNA_END=415 /DNA_ORIENTATION=+
MKVYWSPFHPSGVVAKQFISRFLGAKFRRIYDDVEAEHFLWNDHDRPAVFHLHIDDGTKEGYKFSSEVPDGFTYHEFEDLLMRERRIIETDKFRDEVFRGAQQPQDEEDEDGGYAGPIKYPEGLKIDYA